MYYQTSCIFPIGPVTLGSDGENLLGLWIEGQKYFGASVPGAMVPRDDLPVFHRTKEWLARYFGGERPDIGALPLAPCGGAFRKEVWGLLCEIPYGQVTTYGEIAKKMAARVGRQSMSAQAVGGAVAHNPISIIIPCHRVVGVNGSLTGYAGGLKKKIQLLTLEGVDVTKLSVPSRETVRQEMPGG